MKDRLLMLMSCVAMFVACYSCSGEKASTTLVESREAKALLQGIWVDDVSEEVVFRAVGDTIFYPDESIQPSYFRIINDSLEIGAYRYAIILQNEYFLSFLNQAGDKVELRKSESPSDSLAFVHRTPEIQTTSEVVKMDSVVTFNGERYHWYIVVNPTKYQVTKTSYNNEGVGVENIYYDNIIHISLFQGAKRLFSRDMKKQMYESKVPSDFLSQAILGSISYDHIDSKGVHFNTTLCIPEAASCYMVENLVGFDGQLTMNLLEY